MKTTSLIHLCSMLVAPWLWLSTVALAQVKTATLYAMSKSVYLGPSTASVPGLGSVYAYFTTFDGSASMPLLQNIGGLLYPSGELRPRSAGGYETDYLVAYAGMWDSYGQGVVYYPTTDSDGNGIPDVFQRERPGNTDFSGNTVRQWPSAFSGTVAGRLFRQANSHSGTYQYWDAASPTVLYSGEFSLLYASGTIGYQRGTPNTLTMNFSLIGPGSAVESVTGTTMFTIDSTDRLSIPQFIVYDSGGFPTTVYATSLTRVPGTKTYRGSLEISDGIQNTSWRDFTGWVIEFTDANDTDGNGIPDMTDAIPVPPTINKQPTDLYVSQGTTIVLSVVASGSGSLNYQWRRDGLLLAGANQATLTIGAASAQHNGAYTVTVSNNAGSAVSASAAVTVLKPTGQLHFGLQRLKPDGSFQFVFEGVAGRTYSVETTSALGSWTAWQTVQSTSTWTSVSAPRTPGVSRQFFRVK